MEKLEIPRTIYIETTNLCNAACIMCPHQIMKRPKGTMKEEIFHWIINGLKKYDLAGTQLFLHKEGEPLCDSNIISRIKYAKQHTNAEIGMNTNAMLLNESLSVQLIHSGIDTIYFSVDGVSAATYNKIRINCDYSVVERNIMYFLQQRKKLNPDLRVVMQMILNGINKDEEKLFKEKWSDFDVEFYIKPMHSYLDGGYSTFHASKSLEQKYICKDPFRMITVYIDGQTGCCCWDYDNEYKLGNVMGSDLIKLYNGERIRVMREHQQALNCSYISPCNRCSRIYGEDKICLPDGSWF